LDARRCISYLTIEHAGPIPEDLRPLMGNRIFGCDDCQLVCPWNRWAERTTLPDFAPRPVWDAPDLLTLWAWSEAEYLRHTEGSALRRIGYLRWLRNLAVAMGNALRQSTNAGHTQALRQALQQRAQHPDALVHEHVAWALRQTPNQPAAPVAPA
jgi:epoxyqueuosine reductase